MNNNEYNKMRHYPEKVYWLDTDGLVSEKSYKKSFKKQNNKKERINNKSKLRRII